LIISLLLVWHLLAVFLAPLSIQPSSSLVNTVAQSWMQPYIDAMYLNHGYHFFAPNPGPGHLIRYQIFDDRGGLLERGEFPDLKEYWPRLRYHRYFMLAEQATLPLPREADRKEWERRYLTAYAQRLLRESGGQSVRVQRVAHRPLDPYDKVQGLELDDPKTYEVLQEVTQRRSDLPPDDADQSQFSRGERADVANRWQGGTR
jgi:hypothetical protein